MQTRLEASPTQFSNSATNKENQGYFQSAVGRLNSFGKQATDLLKAHPKKAISSLALIISGCTLYALQNQFSEAATQNPITKSQLFQDVFVLGNESCDQIDLTQILGTNDLDYDKSSFACTETIQAFIAKNCSTADPLASAVRYNKPELVNMFIKAGADLDLKDKHGHTPLHWAIMDNDKDLVRLLIKAQANVDIKSESGETPFHMAITRNAP